MLPERKFSCLRSKVTADSALSAFNYFSQCSEEAKKDRREGEINIDNEKGKKISRLKAANVYKVQIKSYSFPIIIKIKKIFPNLMGAPIFFIPYRKETSL